jgi:hypothetical protein
MTRETSAFLIPAIKKLPGLISYVAATSPSGSVVHVSVWDSDDHAQQMGHLKEMIVDARRAAEIVGVQFSPIVNHLVSWDI